MKKITISKYPLKYDYFITENGEIFSSATNKFLSTRKDKDGYLKVRLISTDGQRHTYSVHRLVLMNFNPVKNMDTLQVNHIDGNKENNSLSNLEWVTCSENIKHAFKIGLKTQAGENNNASKYTEQQVLQAIELLKSKKYNCAEIDRKLGFCKDFTASLKRKDTWKHLTKDIDFT